MLDLVTLVPNSGTAVFSSNAKTDNVTLPQCLQKLCNLVF